MNGLAWALSGAAEHAVSAPPCVLLRRWWGSNGLVISIDTAFPEKEGNDRTGLHDL
jgi:hypothetical protein